MPSPISEQIIAEAARKIGLAAPNAKVILFGLHARGEGGPHGDLDFLVVEPEVDNEAEGSVRLLRALVDLRIPADIIVVSSDYAEEWRDIHGGVVHAAFSEGRVLAS